jgi:hypothetical protein
MSSDRPDACNPATAKLRNAITQRVIIVVRLCIRISPPRPGLGLIFDAGWTATTFRGLWMLPPAAPVATFCEYDTNVLPET